MKLIFNNKEYELKNKNDWDCSGCDLRDARGGCSIDAGKVAHFETPDIFLESAYEYFSSCNTNPWFKSEAVKSGFNAGSIVEVPTQRPYSLGGLCAEEKALSSFLNETTELFDKLTDTERAIVMDGYDVNGSKITKT